MGRGDGGSNEGLPPLQRQPEAARPALAPLPTTRALLLELLPEIEWASMRVVWALTAPDPASRQEREARAKRALLDLRVRLRELVITET